MTTKMKFQLNNSLNKTTGDTPFMVLSCYYSNIEDGALARMVISEEVQSVKLLQTKIWECIIVEHKQ